jgi:hypothetical protein
MTIQPPLRQMEHGTTASTIQTNVSRALSDLVRRIPPSIIDSISSDDFWISTEWSEKVGFRKSSVNMHLDMFTVEPNQWV